MGKLYETFDDQLGVNFAVTTYQPVDTRESVKEFNDLLDKRTFGYVYETMKVLVKEEDCVYLLVSKPDAAQNERGANIGRQFDTKNLDNNKKLWKRLTIETITTKEALQRAKSNLINGALIYIAKDITLDDGTTQKRGFYFCQNVNGEGKLTLAGGSEVVDALDSDSTDAALSAAMGKELNDSIKQLKEYREVSIDFGKNEESITIAIMQPSIISEVKKVNVQKLSLSYGGKVQQEYESGQVDLENSDYLVLDIERTTQSETAVVGLTFKNNIKE
jgi:hypothetical protein